MQQSTWLQRRPTRRTVLRRIGRLAGAGLAAPIVAACGRGGGTKSPITLGATSDLKGGLNPAAPTITQAEQAYIEKINDSGGVNGRLIRRIVEDDGFDAVKTQSLTRKLVEKDHVIAMVGSVGTPPQTAVADYLNQAGVPQLYVLGAAGKWSEFQRLPWTMAFDLSAPDESRIYGKYISQLLPNSKVGILYDNSEYGKDWLTYREPLGPSNPVVAEASFEPTAKDVSPQIATLKAKGVEVLVLIANPIVAGSALKAIAERGWKVTVFLNSPSAIPALMQFAGGPQNVEGVMSCGWYLHGDSDEAGVQEVRDVFSRYAPKLPADDLTIYGYMVGRLIVETVRRAGANPNRESFLAAAESFDHFAMPQLAQGVTVTTGKRNHSPIRAGKLLRATNGRFAYFSHTISLD